jgi:hypothetical protein
VNRAGGYGWHVMAVTKSQAPRRHQDPGEDVASEMITGGLTYECYAALSILRIRREGERKAPRLRVTPGRDRAVPSQAGILCQSRWVHAGCKRKTAAPHPSREAEETGYAWGPQPAAV